MVKNGLQILTSDQRHLLAGKRVGLVSHAAAVLPGLTSSLAAGMRVETLAGVQLELTAARKGHWREKHASWH